MPMHVHRPLSLVRSRLLAGTARGLGPLILAAALATPAPAPAQEFTRQTIMVATLRPVGEPKVASRVGDEVRARIARMGNKREMQVLDPYFVERAFSLSDIAYGRPLGDSELFEAARFMRVDEVLFGTVTAGAGEVTIVAGLRLTRDWGQHQPLPLVRGATAAEAAEKLAGEVTKARQQLNSLRRCENAMHDGHQANAVHFAEDGVKAYPASTFARTCLLAGLLWLGERADSVLRVADQILGLDSLNILATVARASALQAENRPIDAERAWLRVTDLRADSIDLGVRTVEALLQLPRPSSALDVTRRLSALDGKEPRLRRLRFRAWYAMSSWKETAALGDSLDTADDAEFRDDSSYAVRYVDALRQSGDSIGALAVSARSVKRYPGDARVYAQYVALIGGESGAALPRGIMRFPSEPEFYVIAAKNARDAGRRREAIAATAAAVRADPGLTQGYLQMAELWFEEQSPDSALAVLRRAPRTGDGVEMLRSYAIGRGARVLRSAGDTSLAVQRIAVNFLLLADSVESREDSRNYAAAGMLQLARSELVVAGKTRDCAEVKRADAALGSSASLMARGVGSAAGAGDGLKQAWDAMRTAVDNGTRVLCKPPG
jgi:tetratricopeptide (TPR) repeat protein